MKKSLAILEASFFQFTSLGGIYNCTTVVRVRHNVSHIELALSNQIFSLWWPYFADILFYSSL